MENEVIESLLQAIKKLQQEQKNMMAKFTKLTEVCRNKLNKIEQEKLENNKALDKKFAIIQKETEDLRKYQERLCDDVSKLETERDLVNKKIEVIDDTLDKIDKQIDADKKDVEEEHERKQCRFDNFGFCNQTDRCQFFHTNTICDLYQETGTCWRKNCRQRHPKACRYGRRCYRGKSCRYFHFSDPCERCNVFSQKIFYCEFCSKNFCEHCTVEKAHTENIYEIKSIEDPLSTQEPSCAKIHQD